MKLEINIDPLDPVFDATGAFEAYERVRSRLPVARFPHESRHAERLAAVSGHFDLFVFDAYGVLNVGETAIPGAAQCVARLRDAGKACVVVTNAASYDHASAVAKFDRLGYGFSADEIVSSRMAAEASLRNYRDVSLWGVAGLAENETATLPIPHIALEDDPDVHDRVGGVLFLSSARWSAGRQRLLEPSLLINPRPVVIANPDIVAPREDGLTSEPGYFGYRLADLGLPVAFHGKPFPSVYAMIASRFPDIDPSRICVIGDTLHTDILGGAAQGWKTVLVTDHGLFKGLDVAPLIERSGIVPDWIVPTI